MALFKKSNTDSADRRSRALVIIIPCCIILLAGLILGYLYFDTNVDHDKILEKVHVAGVDVGGMTTEQAVNAVKRATQSTYTTKPMTINIDRDTYTIDASESGAKLDVEDAVQAAYNYGRTGFVIRKKIEQSKLKKGIVDVDITPYLNLDTDAIRSKAEALVPNYNTTVVQSTFHLEGEMPSESNQQTGSRKLVIQLGHPGYQLDAGTLCAQILDGYNRNRLDIKIDFKITPPDPIDLEQIAQDSCIFPVDATMNEQTYEITDHALGYGFIPGEVSQFLSDADYDQTYTFEFKQLEPAVTRQSIEETLFQDVLSEYTSTQGSSYARQTNLRLACEAIDGTILLPGEIFDYNSTLGERTPQAGYQLADSYAGMETVSTYGGGICQPSSTLYYCAMKADLEIVSRTNHGFISSYVPYGMDATVSWGGPEFRFKNNTPYPIKIEAKASGGSVTIRLLGNDYKDYYVEMEYEVWGVYPYKTVVKELAPNNPKGYKDGSVITSPYTGYKICTYRCKYDKTTKELISREQEAISVYSTRNKVVAKIVQPEAPSTDPTETP